ncbi:hypothetical protein PIIN_07836 [Serendipita indica DSM 11827]|uniref:non-specific serine/threonine protein kinase n=1 Tax=Serendipita indica (strain DSM 11827) TaxID=1109443 RepID=G4TRE0_SERID|nr:hypothetical protein PIIN_07836 [Serendipita indica DSM 11827]
MCPLVRTSHSPSKKCSLHTVLDRLAFDPTVQDQVWHRAQQLHGHERSGPYSTTMCKCCRKTAKGALEALDALGVGVDPLTQTLLVGQGYEVSWIGPSRIWSANSSSGNASSDPQEPVCARIPREGWHPWAMLPVEPERVTDVPSAAANVLLCLFRAKPDSQPDTTGENLLSATRVLMSEPAVSTYTPCFQLAELAAGVQYLHSQSHVHGSIRPAAVFVDDEGSALLACDSGSSNASAESAYTAPELESDDAEPGTASDVYAFGGLIHWMCTGTDPVDLAMQSLPTAFNSLSLTPPSIFNVAALPTGRTLFKNARQTIAEQTDQTLKSLVAQCRRVDAKQRPPMIMVGLTLRQVLVRHQTMASQLAMGSSLERGLAIGGITSLASFLPKRKPSTRKTESARSTPNMSSMRLFPPPTAPLTTSERERTLAVPSPIPRSASYDDISQLRDRNWEYTQPVSPRLEVGPSSHLMGGPEPHQTQISTDYVVDQHQYPTDPYAEDIAFLEQQRSSRRNDLRVYTGRDAPPEIVVYQPLESPKTPAPPWTPFPMY